MSEGRGLAGLLAALSVTAALVAGCGSHDAADDVPAALSSSAPSLASASAGPLQLTAGYVLAADGGMSGMSGMDSSDSDMAGMDMSGTDVATAYGTISTAAVGSDDALVGASSPASRRVSLHGTSTSADGSAGTMTAVGRMPVPADGGLVLAPGGYHLMLQGLTAPLSPGATVPIVLRFASGTTLRADLPVLAPEDRPAP